MSKELEERIDLLQKELWQVKAELMADDALLMCLIDALPKRKIRMMMHIYDDISASLMSEYIKNLDDKSSYWPELSKTTMLRSQRWRSILERTLSFPDVDEPNSEND